MSVSEGKQCWKFTIYQICFANKIYHGNWKYFIAHSVCLHNLFPIWYFLYLKNKNNFSNCFLRAVDDLIYINPCTAFRQGYLGLVAIYILFCFFLCNPEWLFFWYHWYLKMICFWCFYFSVFFYYIYTCSLIMSLYQRHIQDWCQH